jgi:hypothetical protein
MAEGICKWPIFVDMKTFERFVGVKVVAREYPAVREEKVDLGWNGKIDHREDSLSFLRSYQRSDSD